MLETPGSGTSGTKLSPDCLVLLERLNKAGVRPVHELNPSAARRLGMHLFDLDRQQGEFRLLRRMLRLGPVSAVQLADDAGQPIEDVMLTLERLRDTGVVLQQERQPGAITWSTRLSQQRRRLQHKTVLDRLAGLDFSPRSADVPSNQLSTRHISVAHGLYARLYLPPKKRATSDLPIVLFSHGGGWVIGSIETHDNLCRDLCLRSQCAFLSVEYRLAPEHPWPAGPDDMLQALRWLLKHAAALGLQVEKLALMGDSAGGNLALVTAMAARNLRLVEPQLLILVCPALDASMSLPSWREKADAPFLSAADMRWFYSHYAPDPEDWRGSPLRGDMHGLPRTLVITASHDPLRDEGEAFASQLEATGVDVMLQRYEGMFHDFVLFSPAIQSANDARDQIAAVLRQRLIGDDIT